MKRIELFILFVVSIVFASVIINGCNSPEQNFSKRKLITDGCLTKEECDYFTELFEKDFNVNSFDVIGLPIFDKNYKMVGLNSYHQSFGNYFNSTIEDYMDNLYNKPSEKMSINDRKAIEYISQITYQDVYDFYKLSCQLYDSFRTKFQQIENNDEIIRKLYNVEEFDKYYELHKEHIDSIIFTMQEDMEYEMVDLELEKKYSKMYWLYKKYDGFVWYAMEEEIH